MIKALRSTHKDRVALPPEDFRRLVTWIDCNAPYYGTYAYAHVNTTGGRGIFDAQRGALEEIYKRRCQSCHGGTSDKVMQRIALPVVEKSRSLLAPLAKAAGGYQNCQARGNSASPPVFADTSDPDYRSLLGILTKIRSAAAALPREDMRDDRPPPTDPACRYVYRPGVVREAPK